MEISGIEVKVQHGYGVTDVRLRYRKEDGSQPAGVAETGWITNGNVSVYNGVETPTDTRVVGLMVKEQAGYGVVDVRLQIQKKDGTALDHPYTDWATGNPNVDWLKEIRVPEGSVANGIEGREQAGHGLVDLKLHY